MTVVAGTRPDVGAVLAEHAAVGDCAVVRLPDGGRGHRVAAFVVVVPGARVDAETLRTHVRFAAGRLPVPDVVLFVRRIPRTAAGEVRRAELTRWLAGLRALGR